MRITYDPWPKGLRGRYTVRLDGEEIGSVVRSWLGWRGAWTPAGKRRTREVIGRTRQEAVRFLLADRAAEAALRTE